jgi:cephalosporin-C deacetylase-like acetyl esterase
MSQLGFWAGMATLMLVSPSAQAQDTALTVTPQKASGIYRSGETVRWKIVADRWATPTVVHYSLKANNNVVLQSGDVVIGPGNPAEIAYTAPTPTMLMLDLKQASGKVRQFGAAVSPEKLRPVHARPKDFDAFWDQKKRELRAIPMNAKVSPGPSNRQGVDYALVQLDHINGTKVHGQLARPSKPGKFPAVLVLLWASPPYRLWSDWVTDRAAQGFVVLNIEPHNVLPTEPQSYYDNLPKELKNYSDINQEDRNTNYFVEMYLRGVRAVDYLMQQPDWDGRTIVVTGTSMGGQQSIAVAGLHDAVTHMIVHVPAGNDLNGVQHGHQQGYPSFRASSPKAMAVAPYLDGINFAPRIKAKSLVSMGFIDTITPPNGIWTMFNQLGGPKEVAPMMDSPHNNLATAEMQLPFTERSAEWFAAIAAGRALSPKAYKN